MGSIKYKILIAYIMVVCVEISSMAQEHSDSTTTIGLDEVVVNANTTRHWINGDEYLVTGDMRERSGNIPELLNLLPGIKVNRMDNSLSVENKKNVILLVNGKRYSIDYVKSISLDRVVRVRVNKNPSGRYISEGYDAIIDLKVRDYDGLELSVANFSIVNPTNNGSDKVMMEQPSTSFSYTRYRISVFGAYVYGTSKWNTPCENLYNIENGYHMNGSGVEKYRYHGYVGNIGLNYRLANTHELSVELDYRRANSYSSLDIINPETGHNQSVINETAIPTYGSSIFYRGQYGERMNVYSELAYIYLSSDGFNRLIDDDQAKDDKLTINENKHDIKYTLESEFKTSELLSIRFGYQFGWKKYKSNQEFDYNNTRNKLWVYFIYNPSYVFSTEVGGVVEMENIGQANSNSHNYFRILPDLKFNYTPTNNIHLNLSYIADGNYPTLAMLNPIQTSLHYGVFQRGNPSLRPAISHKLNLENRFFDMFSINLQFNYIKNHIAFLATPESKDVIYIYKNVNLKKITIPLNFEHAIGKYFNFSADGAYYISWGQYENTNNKVDGLWYGANLTYSNMGYMIDFGYNHGIFKENLLQGYEQSGIDSWTLTANKQWLEGKLSTMITWFLPTNLGLSKNYKIQTMTDYYREHTIRSFKPYRNAIVLNLTYRFNSGKSRQTHKRSVIETEERISGFKF